MKNKIKNIFRKKTIGFSIFFVAILLFFGQLAHAEAEYVPVLSDILEAPLRIGLAVVVTAITFGLGVIQLLTAVFCYIGATLVKWVVTTPVKLTSGGVVDVGWTFCRDFANMFFIVVLLAIAYATMLKKETFGMKQALVPLILMALLMNFSQVIAGVVVDISNIFMNFFIQNGAADAGKIFIERNVFTTDVLGIGSDKFWGPFAKVFGKPFAEVAGWAIGVVTKAIVGVLFNIVEFLILLAYGLILTLRIVIIWILVILSPLAFICYVLPATRQFWNMWWKNFIQWATVGIILLFFLYLAGYLMEHSSDVDFFASCKMPGASQPGSEDAIGWGAYIMSEFFCTVLPSIAGLVFLLLGLFLGVSGAGGMPSMAQKIMQRPVKMAGWGTAGYFVSAGARPAKGKPGDPDYKPARPPLAERLITGTAKLPMGGPIAAGLAGAVKQVKEKAGAGLESMTSDALIAQLNNKTTSAPAKERIITILAARNKGGELTDIQLSKISASSIALASALGNVAAKGLIMKDPERLAKAINKTIKDVCQPMTPRTYADMVKTNFANREVFEAADGSKARAVYDTNDPDKIASFNIQMRNDIAQTSFANSAPGEMADMFEGMSSTQRNAFRKNILDQLETELQTQYTDAAARTMAKTRIFEGLTNRNAGLA